MELAGSLSTGITALAVSSPSAHDVGTRNYPRIDNAGQGARVEFRRPPLPLLLDR